MLIFKKISELRAWRHLNRDRSIGFVPTMGALHEGHLDLIRRSGAERDLTIASIFVNPLQFGPNEDLSKYPRNPERDAELLSEAGCDALFLPTVETMYPGDRATLVRVERVSEPLCGAFRPGHFDGVATVVLKLFHLVDPNVAYFGQKDAQQCAVIERMVRDLDLSVRIQRHPTRREPDGLAMSSRNAYLSPEQREIAPAIYQSLMQVKRAYNSGERSTARLAAIGRAALESKKTFQIQYWEIRHPRSLETIESIGAEGGLAAVAAYLGTTRLIDNLWLGGPAELSSSQA